MSRELARLLGELTPPARAVMVLRYQEDRDVAEIGATLDMPVNTVKSHIKRSLTALRGRMIGAQLITARNCHERRIRKPAAPRAAPGGRPGGLCRARHARAAAATRTSHGDAHRSSRGGPPPRNLLAPAFDARRAGRLAARRRAARPAHGRSSAPQREQRAGLAASRELMQALRVTSQKLDLAYEAVKRPARSGDEEENRS